MADEATSVGKIQFDFEIAKESISREMQSISKVFNSGFKNPFTNMGSQGNNFVKDTISKMTGQFRNFATAGKQANDEVAQSVENIGPKMENLIHQMDNAVNRAEMYRQKLKGLEEQYSRLSEKQITSDRGMKLGEQILIAKERVLKYGEVADRTRIKIENLENSMNALGNTANQSSTGFKKAEIGAKKATRSFKDLGNESTRSSSKVGGFSNMISSTFMRILKRIFIINLIYKAIRGLMNYLNSALQTNKNFSNSLTTIQTNLKVAFQPIYEFILPALQALMRALATITGYIASFMSALFGKTYQQSFKAAKGIDSAKKAMSGYGGAAKKAAKEAKGALAGFDEINQLDIQNPDDDSSGDGGGGGLEMEIPEAVFDFPGLDAFKALLEDLFKPLKLAWDKEGLNVINAFKDALEKIKGLLRAIAKSWMEVWTNGTGQAIIEAMLRILTLVLKIIGDIADAFRIAWETNELGTKLIQAMADAFLSILELIEAILISWREVWNNGTGVKLATSILTALTLVFNIIKDIASAFKTAWESGKAGTKLIQSILDMFINVIDLIVTIGESWRDVWNNGTGVEFIGIILGILTEVFTLIGNIADAFRIAWEENNTGTAIIQNIADALNAVLGIFREIGESINKVWGEVGQKVINVFMESLKSATGILKTLGDALKTIWDKGGKHLFESLIKLGAKFIEIAGVIWNGFIAPVLDWIIKILAPVFGFILDVVADMVDDLIGVFDLILNVLNIIKTFVDGVIGFFKHLYDVLVGHSIIPDLVNAIVKWFTDLGKWVGDKVKALVDSVKKFFTDLWDSIKKKTEETWNALTTFLDTTWTNIKTKIEQVWNGIKEFFSKTWAEIKAKVEEVWNSIKSFLVDKIWNPIKSSADTIWKGIKDNVIKPINEAYTKLQEVWNNIKKYILDKWDEIKSGIVNKKNDLVNSIMDPFNAAKEKINSVIRDAKDWGKNLVGNFIDGISSMIGKVGDAASKVVGKAADFMRFRSPSKEGPGKDADTWMPNFMSMIVDGIENNIGNVKKAVSKTASLLGGLNGVSPNISMGGGLVKQPDLNMTSGRSGNSSPGDSTDWMDKLGEIIANALMGVMQLNGSGGSNDSAEAILNLDGITFARAFIPMIDRELMRMGYKTIYRTT